MKKHLLILFSIVFFSLSFGKAQAQDIVLNGGSTKPINFPAGSCVYNWTNNNTSIGLAATGTGNIASFTAVNTGSSPVTATITATPVNAAYAYIPNSGDGTVSVVNMATNTVVSTIQVGAFPFAVAASADGKRVYVTNQYAKSVSVINTADNTVMATVTVGTYPDGAAVSPDGTRAYITNNSDNLVYEFNTVSVINTLTNSVVSTITIGPDPIGVSVSPDGAFVYVANSYSNTVSVIQASTNTVTATITVGLHPFGVCFSPDGSKAYVTNHDEQTVSIINTATKTVIGLVNVGDSPYGICSSPDGKNVYVANLGGNSVSVINTALNSVTATIPVGALPYGICVSPDGRDVYVPTRGTNSISTINTATNMVSATTKVGTEPYSFGNFVINGSGCNGTPVTFTITVNPTIPTITATSATGTISACAGTASASPQIQQFTVSGSGLKSSITAMAPAAFEISLAAGTGYGSSVSIPQISGAVSGTMVYVRSAATAPTGAISGNVKLTSAGAGNQTVVVAATVNALPTVNTVSNQTVNNGAATTAVSFTGTANSFTWVNDTPGIGLAASGTGDIASFTAVNTGTSPITATITVTPKNAGYAYIANSGSDDVTVINTGTNALITTIPVGSAPIGVASSPDGSRVYVTCNGTISVINTAANTVVSTINIGTYAWGILVSPDGSKLYVAYPRLNSVAVINAATGAVISTIVFANPSGALAISPDGGTLYVGNSISNTVSVVNTANNAIIATIPVGLTPNCSTISPDGSRLYVTNADSGTLSVISTATNMVIATVTVGSYPYGVVVSPDGSRVYVSNNTSASVSVIDAATNGVIATVPAGPGPTGISINSDGDLVYVTDNNGNNVSVINTATNMLTGSVSAGQAPYSIGNFITPGKCNGLPTTFTIIVNPTAPTITASMATGIISACAGTASADPQIQQFTVSGSGLTGGITAMAPAGFELSLIAASGYASSVTIPQTSGAVSGTIVYVRSAATAATGGISGNVTLTSAGAGNQTVAVRGTVNALPTVSTVADQTLTSGAATTAVNFTGTGNTFTWTNDTPGIGLAANGSGNIASFTAVNTGTSPITATIAATPITAGYAYITNAGNSSVSLINTQTNSIVGSISVGSWPEGIALSQDGSRIYVANRSSGTVSVVNASTNQVISTIFVDAGPVGVVVSPDGSRIYVARSFGNNVSVISTATNTELTKIAVGSFPSGIAISPDGSKVYVTNDYWSNISVINTATNMVDATVSVGSGPSGVAVSPDGNFVYVTNAGEISPANTVSVISTQTNKVVSTITVGLAPIGISISPDGSRIFVVNDASNTVSVINAATNLVVATINVGDRPVGVSFTADGSRAYVTDEFSDDVSVINTQTNTVTTTISTERPMSLGNFVSNGISCPGTPIKFTITVNPTSPTITASTAIGTISACTGSASTSPNLQQFTVSGSGLTGNITATAPANFELSLAAGSGYSNKLTLNQAGGAMSSTVVYVRAAATAPIGGISGNVTLTSAGASNQTVAVTGIVNALPTVNAVGNQTVNNGAATAAVSFTGTANTFSWVNDAPGIGLAASGAGDIASFTAVNNGNSAITATVTVTPTNNGSVYITNGNDNSVSVYNSKTGSLITKINTGADPFGVAVSKDNTRVYIGNQSDATVSVIDAKTNKVIATIPVGGSTPFGVAINADGSRLYVANSASNTVSVINTISNAVIATIATGSNSPQPIGIAVSPDNKKVYVTSGNLGEILVIDAATNSIAGTIADPGFPVGLCVSPDGGKIYATNGSSNTVSVIDATANAIIATVPVGTNPFGLSVSPDGSLLYVANNSSNSVSVIDTKTNQLLTNIAVGTGPRGISFTSDGSLAYVTNENSNNVSVINTATNGVISTIAAGAAPHSDGDFISSGTDCAGPPIQFTITVNPSPPTITASTATGNISACAGTASASPNIQQFTVSGSGLTGNITATAPTNFEISLAAGSGYSNSLTLIQAGGAVSSTIVYVRSAATLPNGTTTANVLLSSPGAPDQTVSVAGTVNPMVAASLAIAASGNNICAGTPVTFTASPTNGGSSPVYQWLVNGNNTGTNSPTFTSNTIANGDFVSCVMTGSGACTAPANATSNTIPMNVIANVTPSISIVASQNTICAGTPVTFTAMPINGGSTPVYQWLVNGNNAGTNSITFSGTTFADGDAVSCVITSNAGCAAPASATSNGINMIVSPFVNPAIGITVSQNNVCPGTNVTFTATPTNGGNSPVYQWLLNGNNVGVNSLTFSSSTLSNGDIISCRITSNATCLTVPDAISNTITMIVNAQEVPAVSIAISANNVCAGTPVTFTATPTNGGSAPVYQWLVNGNNAGTNGPTFTSALANGDVVSCVMTTSLVCATPANIPGNSITMIVFPLPVVNGGGDKVIEKGSSVALTATAPGNIADITWSPLTGLDNNKILTPRASPTSTTLYTITVQNAEGCTAISSVTVTVLDGISIPNTFTPNGDGVNDKWDIQNLKDYQNCEVRIFDRYGGEVYSSKGYYNAWDGTMKGRRLPVGTYYYVINLNDGTRPLSGFVALIR